MTLTVRVERGTGAGTRPAFRGAAPAWWCRCPEPECCRLFVEGDCCQEPDAVPREQPGYMASCPDCGERRPA